MIVQALKWIGGADGFLELIDQRRLPAEFIKLQCRDIEALFEAIKTLAVRGAPAIGVSAAYGLVLAMQKLKPADGLEQGLKVLAESVEYLSSSRPTAVNLFWALERVCQNAKDFATWQPEATVQELREAILAEANAICQEDVDMCRAGQGTALSVMFEAHKNGKKFRVYADETRPLLQGARLTAWELKQAGIDVTVICDNMSAYLMKQGRVDTVITGADRIAANGDAANKIGTYSLSILAREHGIPFYIAVPSSTFDLSIKSGAEIPIEQRPADEVAFFGDRRTVPEGVDIYNPAFDITEAQDIAAIITERGVIEKPNADSISGHLSDDSQDLR